MDEKMKELIAEQLNVDAESVSEASNFKADLGADSLDLFELVMSLEEEFDLPEIPEEELKAIESVGDLVDYVEKNVKE